MKTFAILSILLTVFTFSPLQELEAEKKQLEGKGQSKTEIFTFLNNGIPTKGKIFLPASYKANKELSAIYLIDFREQHFKLATDEFEKVIEGVQKIRDLDALVVSLEHIADIDAEPETYQEHYQLFKNMAAYVNAKYTKNSSGTFIGKGSEAGVVLMSMFLETRENSVFDNFIVTDPSPLYASAMIKMIENNDFPNNKSNKKLHFSFSTSNDRSKCNTLISRIDEANYPWLQFRYKEYTDSNYENTYPVSFAEGLAFIFNTD